MDKVCLSLFKEILHVFFLPVFIAYERAQLMKGGLWLRDA